AALSPDGEHLAVRGYLGGIHYAWNDGKPQRKGRLSVPLQGQGESVTFSADGTRLLYGTEGAESPVEAREAPGAKGAEGATGDGGGAAGDGLDDGVMIGGAAVAVICALLFARGRRRRG